MRQRQLRQRPYEIGARAAGLRDAVGPANNKTQIAAVCLPIGQLRRHSFTCQLFAHLVEQHDLFIVTEFCQYQLALRLGCPLRFVFTRAPYRRNTVDAKLPLSRKSAGIAAKCIIDPGRLPITDGNQPNMHGSVITDGDIASRTE